MISIRFVLLSVVFVSVSADLISDLCKDCEACFRVSPRWRDLACRDFYRSLLAANIAKWQNLLTLRRMSDEEVQVLNNLKGLGLEYDGRRFEIHTHCGAVHNPTFF